MIRLLSLILLLLVLSPNITVARENKQQTISPWLYKKLLKTEQLISKKSYHQAEQKLKSLLSKVDNKSYEQAVVLRSLSSVYALNNQYKKAAKILSKAINLNVLPKNQEQQTLLNLGQLYMATEQFSKAIKTLEPWLAKNPNPDAKLNALLANAYAQLKQYRKALPFIKKAIASSKQPDESWYQLNLALYYELENYNSAATILKKLIHLYPDKKTYWLQLSAIYQQLKQYKKAVSIKHLAYKKGFLVKEKEIIELANLFLYVHRPYKAASLVQQELAKKRLKSTSKNWELLAQAWNMAREFSKAIKALETASKLNNKGSLYQQLGQNYLEQEKWKQAITSFNKAISKGGLKNTGTTYLLLGMSYYELGNTPSAKKFFLKAMQYSKNKKAAKQWLEYIEKAS